ncbi:MAG: J domain-containing protein [Candidatus Tectomicrobia bacterium]|nr:J domain-containing protein [Candidatus Tectomicrobia bacterium]
MEPQPDPLRVAQRTSEFMSELLQRLLNIARAQLHDVLDFSASGSPIGSWWDRDFTASEAEGAFRQASGQQQSRQRASGADFDASAHAHSGLPYSPELARYYALLDLPFGAPMEQVSKRWKNYLKKCHPDRFTRDPAQQADATELTQALTGAHDNILAAWQRYQK